MTYSTGYKDRPVYLGGKWACPLTAERMYDLGSSIKRGKEEIMYQFVHTCTLFTFRPSTCLTLLIFSAYLLVWTNCNKPVYVGQNCHKQAMASHQRAPPSPPLSRQACHSMPHLEINFYSSVQTYRLVWNIHTRLWLPMTFGSRTNNNLLHMLDCQTADH